MGVHALRTHVVSPAFQWAARSRLGELDRAGTAHRVLIRTTETSPMRSREAGLPDVESDRAGCNRARGRPR